MYGRLLHSCIQNGFRNVNDVLWQLAVTYRIFGDKFQQCRIPKVIPSFENYGLPWQGRGLVEMCAKPLHIARVDQVTRTPESRVFNSLVMRQLDLIARPGLLNA